MLTQNQYVLGMAEMGLIFPIADLIALCFILVARKVLIIHQCFGYCWAVLAQHQGCLSNIPPSLVGWGWARTLGDTQPGKLTQTDERDIPYHMMSAQQKKLRERRRRRGICYYICLLEQPLCILKLCSQASPACGKYRINALFFFASTHGISFCFIKLALSWSMRSFPSYFLPSLSFWEGER